MADSLWKDPFPPEDFRPDDKTVASILDRANQPGVLPKGVRPRWNRRSIGGIAGLAALFVVAIIAGRGMQMMWGEKLASGGAMDSAVAQATTMPSADYDAQDMLAPAQAEAAMQDGAMMDSAQEEMEAPAEQQEPAYEAEVGAAHPSGSNGAMSEAPVVDLIGNPVRVGIAGSDAVIYGVLSDGILTVEETLCGEYGGETLSIAVPGVENAKAYALLVKGERWALPQEGAALLVESAASPGALLILDAAGRELATAGTLGAETFRAMCEQP